MGTNLENFKNELLQLLNKSQDNFEKQLSYISAGAIGISMAFIEKITGEISSTNCKIYLITGWFLLTITLLINLFSHIAAYKNHYKTIEEIDANKYDQSKAIYRNRVINYFNYTSIFTLILGIISIIVFVTINIFKS